MSEDTNRKIQVRNIQVGECKPEDTRGESTTRKKNKLGNTNWTNTDQKI